MEWLGIDLHKKRSRCVVLDQDGHGGPHRAGPVAPDEMAPREPDHTTADASASGAAEIPDLLTAAEKCVGRRGGGKVRRPLDWPGTAAP